MTSIAATNSIRLGDQSIRLMDDIQSPQSQRKADVKQVITEAVAPSLVALQSAKLAKKILKQVTSFAKAIGFEGFLNDTTKTVSKTVTLIGTGKTALSKIIGGVSLVYAGIELGRRQALYDRNHAEYEKEFTAHIEAQEKFLKEFGGCIELSEARLLLQSSLTAQQENEVADAAFSDDGAITKTRQAINDCDVLSRKQNELADKKAELDVEKEELTKQTKALEVESKKLASSTFLRIPKILSAASTLLCSSKILGSDLSFRDWVEKFKEISFFTKAIKLLNITGTVIGIAADFFKMKGAIEKANIHTDVLRLLSHSPTTSSDMIAKAYAYRKKMEEDKAAYNKKIWVEKLITLSSLSDQELLKELKKLGVAIQDFRTYDENQLKAQPVVLNKQDIIFINSEIPQKNPNDIVPTNITQEVVRAWSLRFRLEREGVIAIDCEKGRSLKDKLFSNEILDVCATKYAAFKEVKRKLALTGLKQRVLDKMGIEESRVQHDKGISITHFVFTILAEIGAAILGVLSGWVTNVSTIGRLLPSLAMFVVSLALTAATGIHLWMNQPHLFKTFLKAIPLRMMFPKIAQAFYEWRVSSNEKNLKNAQKTLLLLEKSNPKELKEYLDLDENLKKRKYLPQSLSVHFLGFDVTNEKWVEEFKKILAKEEKKYRDYEQKATVSKSTLDEKLKNYKKIVENLHKQIDEARIKDVEQKTFYDPNPNNLVQSFVPTEELAKILIETDFWSDEYALRMLEKYFGLSSEVLEKRDFSPNQQNILNTSLQPIIEKIFHMDPSQMKKWIKSHKRGNEVWNILSQNQEPLELKVFLENKDKAKFVPKDLQKLIAAQNDSEKWKKEYEETLQAKLKKYRVFATNYEGVDLIETLHKKYSVK